MPSIAGLCRSCYPESSVSAPSAGESAATSSPTKLPARRKSFSPCPCLPWVFLFAASETKAPDWRRAAGFCLPLLAIVLFVWAILAARQKRPALAFAGKRPDHVFSWGPYAYIRHPFYTAYLLFWLGCVVATSSLIMVIMFVSLSLRSIRSRRSRGAQFLALLHARRVRSVSERDRLLLAEVQTGATSAMTGFALPTRPKCGSNRLSPTCASSFSIMLSATILQFGSSIMSCATLSKTSASAP
jgi:protein-S-isoprenylcysteine O-methyltransferase Ste14